MRVHRNSSLATLLQHDRCHTVQSDLVFMSRRSSYLWRSTIARMQLASAASGASRR